MGEKRPLCDYGGSPEELHSGDTVNTVTSDPGLLQNLLLDVILSSRWNAKARREIVNGFTDGLYDSTGIDAGLSTYTYDASGDRCLQGSGSGGYSSAGNLQAASGWTRIETASAVPNGVTITTVGMYSTTTTGSLKFKIALYNGGDSYTLTALQTFTKSASGYQSFTLSTPYVVPSSGTYYLALYLDTTQDNHAYAAGSRALVSGDITGETTTIAQSGYRDEVAFGYIMNAIVVSTATTALATALKAMAVILVESYHSSLKVYFSSATSPSWTELTTLVKVATPLSSVDAYVSDLTSVTGSADKSHRLKITFDAGNSTAIHGFTLKWTV